MNEFLQPDQKNSKIHMEQNLDLTKSSFLVITKTIHKRKRKIYLDITNKWQHGG